eukprot:6211325-Pleurochrysis_carterae.AAC.1
MTLGRAAGAARRKSTGGVGDGAYDELGSDYRHDQGGEDAIRAAKGSGVSDEHVLSGQAGRTKTVSMPSRRRLGRVGETRRVQAEATDD